MMNFTYTPYIVPLIFAALISMVVGIYTWSRRDTRGALALSIMASTIFVWTVGYALEIAGNDLGTKYFWGVIQYFGIAFAPYGWLIFSLQYNDRIKSISTRTMLALGIVPTITLLLALTTKWHGLIWQEFHINYQGQFSALGVTYGKWFYIHLAYSYLSLIAGTILLGFGLWQKQGMYRSQLISLLIAVLTPWVGNALYLTGHSPIPYLDLTPFAFTITVAALAWSIFGFHLVDITPIARDRVIDSMQDGMIVIDTRGNIVDINSAAARMIGVTPSQAVGKTVGDILTPWPQLIERFRDILEGHDEITIGDGAAIRKYEVRLSPLMDRQNQLVGRIIIVHSLDAAAALQQTASIPIAQTITHPNFEAQTLPRAKGFFSQIADFFAAPVLTDLAIPLDTSPSWYQARERSFTIILRISAVLGALAYLLTLPLVTGSTITTVNLVYGGVIALLWLLGLARRINFSNRAATFLVLIYVLASVETLNFGFSVESFTFFMTLIIISVLLTGRTGGILAGIITFVTLGIFGWVIGHNGFIPYNSTAGLVTPRSFEMAMTSLFVLSACAVGLGSSITILTGSLNRAWQLESQALNLLQQERDLLEKHVEDRTRELALFMHAVENSGNTIIIMDKDGLVEYVNPRFTEISGYSLDEVKKRSPSEVLSSRETSSDFHNSDSWKTMNSGRIWTGEFQNRRKDGTSYWETASIAPVYNNQGEISNFVEIKQDITEHKILQEQLEKQNNYLSILHQVTLDLLNRREINDLLQAIVDHSATLLDAPYIALLLKEGNELVASAVSSNQSELKHNRVKREQARLSWQAFDTMEPAIVENYSAWQDRRNIFDEIALQAVAEFPIIAGDICLGVLSLGRVEAGYTFTAEQIQTGILFARLASIVLDNINLYDSAMREISERKLTQALLQENESRFRQIIENASDLIYRTDERGLFTYANPSALHMMGYKSEKEVLGKSYLELTTPEMRHKLKRTYERQLISKTKNSYFEFPAVTADGNIIWVGQNVQLIFDGPKLIGFQAVARNITELREAHEALALSRDRALEASRLKSQLLSRVSHELRTPLNGILGYAELLSVSAFGELTEKQKNASNQIIQSANYLTQMVSDLLDEAQIESKSMSLTNKYFAPADLMNNVTSTLSSIANKKGVSLNTEISPELPIELYGDIKRLQQIIFNLAGNSMKFTKSGEVRIQFLRPTPTQWAIQINDTGVGIPKDALEYIFEPFRQVDNNITPENRGSGLGLSITKQLIELMNGQVAVQSEINKGSIFTVLLPIINAPGE